jgi:hypothetical protein
LAEAAIKVSAGPKIAAINARLATPGVVTGAGLLMLVMSAVLMMTLTMVMALMIKPVMIAAAMAIVPVVAMSLGGSQPGYSGERPSMRSDYVEEFALADIMRTIARLEAKYRSYFSRFFPDLVLTIRFGYKPGQGPIRLLKQIVERLRELEASAQQPVAWLIVVDRGKSGRLLRFHLLITGIADVRQCQRWEFKAPSQLIKRRITWTDSHGTALFLAQNGMGESNEFHFGGSLITDDPDAPDEMRQSTIHPARKTVVERYQIEVGADPKCKITPIQIHIEAKGCDEDGRGSGYGYLIANTGKRHVDWHDGWLRDEAIYHAMARAIEDVPMGKHVSFLVGSRAVVARFENESTPKMHRKMLRPVPQTREEMLRLLARKHRELLRLLARTGLRMKELGLTATVEWIPRNRNRARHLLVDPTSLKPSPPSTGTNHHPSRRNAAINAP